MLKRYTVSFEFWGHPLLKEFTSKKDALFFIETLMDNDVPCEVSWYQTM